MPIFVHLTSAANAPRIRRSGIRAAGRGERGVHCFPVLPSYTLTHQWVRELARFGTRGGLVAVHFRLDDAEPVTVRHYGGPGEQVTAAEAAGRLAAMADPRGWEVFLPRSVAAGEVHRLRRPPQVAGWRYFPSSHGRRPCQCDGCRVRGEYGGRRLRERLPHPLDGPPPPTRVLLERLAAAGDPGDPEVLIDLLHWFGLRRRRKGPLAELARLAAHPDPQVRAALVRTVWDWSSPGRADLVDGLADDRDHRAREAVADAREWLADRD
ncbi:HEAT repeat domain-containing protein [Kitasatospora sp. DSM 101779]|uniref:HEAT repeat domain-containing protein n=1 Tax=Kitasatospora sp. DSM 101779 TaxID=2853165 RepID=UPI0021D9723E|nr:HEAT repeat domain-containing protein [Kitasatospora sp. DSM 101779]MCU7825884.1 HEAT repeat domain-containing protein [Kitasatospora sp. DSM 101779]